MADASDSFRGKRRGDEDASSSAGVVYRLLVPNVKMGPILGKDGSNIKSIRDESGARVKISNNCLKLEERVAVISSRDPPGTELTCAEMALFRLYPLAVIPAPEDRSGVQVQVRLLVGPSQAGAVLGKGGSKIKDLRESTGASIHMNEHSGTFSLPNDRVLQVSGTDEKVDAAIKAIASILRDRPPKESLAELEGTAGSTKPVQTAIPVLPAWSYVSVLPPGNLSDDPYKRRRLQEAAHAVVPIIGQPQMRAELHITGAAIGAVLGHGGNTIKNIRSISGASVKVHNSDTDSEHRLIEIIGNQVQVESAQQLIQACVAGMN